MEVSLTITQRQHTTLKTHILKDGKKETAAILLCGRRAGSARHRLVVQSVYCIPDGNFPGLSSNRATWNIETLCQQLDRAGGEDLTIVVVHSRPDDSAICSPVEDEIDKQLLAGLQDWKESDAFHASVIMLADGSMFGRYIDTEQQLQPLNKISLVGDTIHYWLNEEEASPEFVTSHLQAFGEGTYAQLKNLSVAVVGCSGTGSPVIEQLARLGVGRLVLVDDDIVEVRNLNRIINSTMEDAHQRKQKVDVLADAIEQMGLGTSVERVPHNLWEPHIVEIVGQCDILFGCMDTIDGRYLLNRLATYYSMPYFDLGVRITPGEIQGEVDEVCGSVHYLQPGQSLMQRKVFTMSKVSEAGLARQDPEAYKREIKDGYIKGVAVERPAVVSLNTLIASLGINELLARIHPYRDDGDYDQVEVSLTSMVMFSDPHHGYCNIFGKKIGFGDQKMMLDLPELS